MFFFCFFFFGTSCAECLEVPGGLERVSPDLFEARAPKCLLIGFLRRGELGGSPHGTWRDEEAILV